MAPQSELHKSTHPERTLESWALPITATIIVAGALLLRIGVPMVELAAQSPQQQPAPIVIWLPAAATSNATPVNESQPHGISSTNENVK